MSVGLRMCLILLLRALGSNPAHSINPGVVSHAYNPSTEEVQAARSEFQACQLCSKLEANHGEGKGVRVLFMRACLKSENNRDTEYRQYKKDGRTDRQASRQAGGLWL